jgi:hypothetical protein
MVLQLVALAVESCEINLEAKLREAKRLGIFWPWVNAQGLKPP